jgi:hypothetical protein
MDGSYYSVRPHLEETSGLSPESVEINSYTVLRDVVTEMIESGSTEAFLSAPEITVDQLTSYMDTVRKTVLENNALGAYAVEEIEYEIGTNRGKTAISINIQYTRGRSEIRQIKQAQNMEQANRIVANSLENLNSGVVFRVKLYEDTDFTQLIQDYVEANPQSCMELPQVAVAVYPETGTDRIVELTYTYQTSRESLRSMQEQVEPIFSSAALYVNQEAELWEQYSQLYSFLLGRDTYVHETSITPSYSLLCHGVGDSKAFAMVYAAMCRQAGLDCNVVSGTRNAEAFCWNVVNIDGVNYHINLLGSGGFAARTAAEMNGYVWDYAVYP